MKHKDTLDNLYGEYDIDLPVRPVGELDQSGRMGVSGYRLLTQRFTLLRIASAASNNRIGPAMRARTSSAASAGVSAGAVIAWSGESDASNVSLQASAQLAASPLW